MKFLLTELWPVLLLFGGIAGFYLFAIVRVRLNYYRTFKAIVELRDYKISPVEYFPEDDFVEFAVSDVLKLEVRYFLHFLEINVYKKTNDSWEVIERIHFDTWNLFNFIVRFKNPYSEQINQFLLKEHTRTKQEKHTKTQQPLL